MATLQYRTLSNRTVERLKAEKDTVFWDRELTGFGVRIYPTGGKVYVVQARGPVGARIGGQDRREYRGGRPDWERCIGSCLMGLRRPGRVADANPAPGGRQRALSGSSRVTT